MIIPILNGLLKFSKAPVTWILFLLNGAVFVASLAPSIKLQAELEKHLDDPNFIQIQGRLFAQFIGENPQSYSGLLRQLAAKSQTQDGEEKIKLLGSLAVRNSQFLEEAPDHVFQGDQVEISQWRETIKKLRFIQDRHPSYIWGLTSDQMGLERWVSYIFVHSGPYHFLGNMYFLLIFGSMLEPLIGGLALMIVFLGSGIAAAGAFLLLTGATAAPLIGASGAVSGLMVLFCLFYWKTPVRYMYMLLPSTRYVGYVFLPSWCVGAMFILSDVAGYFGGINEFGGVAYSAHLGGELTALLIGAAIYLVRYRKPERLAAIDPEVVIGKPISIADTIEKMRHADRNKAA